MSVCYYASALAATADCVNSDISGGRWTPTGWLATLVYAIVSSRIDYCNTVLAGAPRTLTDKLQRVLNAAARVVTGTWKFDRGLGQILHDELHWLDVPDRVFFKLAVTVHRCLNETERLRTAVPVGLLRYGRRCRHLAAPAFRQPSTACSTSLPVQHLRPSGLFSFRPHSLELCPTFHPGPDHECRLFQTFA